MSLDVIRRACNFVQIRMDPESFSIRAFVESIAKDVKPGDTILDAGAGDCRYSNDFSHADYEATDISERKGGPCGCIKYFSCDLHSIPKPNNHYDVILSTQVLEHVRYPQRVINEFFRVLKSGGRLYLTAPQGWGLHCDPHHYFNFTKYGLDALLTEAGFEIVYIRSRGGIFWYLSKIIQCAPRCVFTQSTEVVQRSRVTRFLRALVRLPVIVLCRNVFPLALFYLDSLDTKQSWTLGYACYAVKK